MAELERIPISRKVRWRIIRQRVLPIVFFTFCVTSTLVLWNRKGAAPTGVGEVEAVRLDVAAGSDGQLVTLSQKPWMLFDEVVANEIIARLDDRATQAAIATLQQELLRLRLMPAAMAAQLAAEDADRQHEKQREAMRLSWENELRRLDVVDRHALIEADRVVLRRLSIMFERWEALAVKSVVSEMQLDDHRLLRDEVEKRISINELALKEAKRQLQEAKLRVANYPRNISADQSQILAPLRSAISVQEARIEELRVQVDSLDVRAPITGTIAAIHLWPGQQVSAGDPIVTIAANDGRFIVSYVREYQRVHPEIAAKVEVRARQQNSHVSVTRVDRIGPQVELVPMHQLRDPNVPEWGIPIRIAMPDGVKLHPGQLVDIRY